MDELVDRVRQALAAEYPGAPNGRVRDVPDRRAIRWYATTGLVDRPLGMQGRNAVYGPRHLLQLVAVKRRQAQGHSLAAIQAELTGASDAELAAVARVPDSLLTGAPVELDPGTARPRFWADAPAPAPAASPPDAPPAAAEVGGIALGGGVYLVLPVRPVTVDFVELGVAARPLVRFLSEHGLLHAHGSPATDRAHEHDHDLLTNDDRSAS
ncbi:MerR family transcriptional regulator [Actinoplanes sp. N902-109]|uniref:MerR family transcriptional regulator n=1 Tax=Actinoplanes sp. (strain N902-109) TaxID=649831 RepID=UPI001E5AE14D|nr:MerR family transcriptional regulator [Actinoplanes sp. N902-109]